MPVAGVVTIILAAVIVLALALYLTWVVLLLRKVEDTLGKVTFGVRAIAHRTSPLKPVLTDVNTNLSAVAGALEDLSARVGSRTGVR